MKKGENYNHPKKGTTYCVSPIRSLEEIRRIKEMLADRPRDLALFTLGVNSNLRASDLVRVKAGDVRHLGPGGLLQVKEKKTGKLRQIPLNKTVVETIQNLLRSRHFDDDEPLFQGRKGALGVPYVSMMVKSWCKAVGCNHGNYAAHSLRKTFGFHQHTTFGVDLPRLMTCFNHSSQGQTLTYIGIQAEEIHEVFMNEL